jgi:hypothetical protein
MRLLFFILTVFFGFCACQIPGNKDSSVGSTTHIDVAKDVIIQNSGPRGGGYLDSSGTTGYTDSTGTHFGYAIFWTGVINKTPTPLELTINFPADSFAIFSSPDSYLKLFLPPDTMTLEKEPLDNYGVIGLKSFLDTGFNKPTRLQRIINPKEACLFYVVMLNYKSGGMVRAGLVLKEQDLFYRFSVDNDSALIPCGHINFKK